MIATSAEKQAMLDQLAEKDRIIEALRNACAFGIHMAETMAAVKAGREVDHDEFQRKALEATDALIEQARSGKCTRCQGKGRVNSITEQPDNEPESLTSICGQCDGSGLVQHSRSGK